MPSSAMLLADRDHLEASDLTKLTRTASPVPVHAAAGSVNIEDVERQLLVQALGRSKGNKTQAAQLLGINPRPGALPHREVSACPRPEAGFSNGLGNLPHSKRPTSESATS